MQDRNEKKEIWFKAKLYGWGWTPTTWQGWAILLVWAISNIYNFIKFGNIAHSGSDSLIATSPFFIISTIVLLLICYKKGERPHWSWGEKEIK